MSLFVSQEKIVVLLLLLVVLIFTYISPLCLAFTVIMPDSDVPSALVDAPQTGFSMSKNGARTDAREQEAVYDIMRATGNDWATDIPDVCRGRWHGIECMPDNNNVFHVVSLSFGALSDDTAFPTCDPTQSYISPSITKLPHIKTLFFYRCFSYNPQPIPAFLGQLGSTLQTLVLRENGYVGPIPNELTNLTHLKVLDLHKNNLTGSIPVSLNRITGLRSLDLSVNRLTGSIPDLALPVLNVLDLNQNHLMGSIPSSIGSICKDLLKINFSRNRLFGAIPDSIICLNDLILMDLSFNRLSGSLPISLKDLNSLQALILKGNPMTATRIPKNAFEGMNNLTILILSNMNLQGEIPDSLGRLPNLRVVHLDGNQLNGSIPVNFRGLKNLSELRLNDNRLTGPIPLEREMAWRMRKKLKIYNNSGLCYDENSGFDSSFDLGIGYCNNNETPKGGSSSATRAGGGVQHVTSSRSIDVDRNVPNFVDEESYATILKSSSLVGRLIQLTCLVMISSLL